jgi:hypothetical protein
MRSLVRVHVRVYGSDALGVARRAEVRLAPLGATAIAKTVHVALAAEWTTSLPQPVKNRKLLQSLTGPHDMC